MAEMTDVYVKIKYVQNGVLQDDNLLDDLDLFNAAMDLEYNGIFDEVEEEGILRAYGRNYYPFSFEEDNKWRQEYFSLLKEKGISMLYYIFCDFSYAMERIFYGVISMDILKNKVDTKILKQISYEEYMLSCLEERSPELREKYEDYVEEELDEEEMEEFYESITEIVSENILEEFREFQKNIIF